MVLPGSPVTFTLTVSAPTASATWKPVLPVSASVSTVSEAFRCPRCMSAILMS